MYIIVLAALIFTTFQNQGETLELSGKTSTIQNHDAASLQTHGAAAERTKRSTDQVKVNEAATGGTSERMRRSLKDEEAEVASGVARRLVRSLSNEEEVAANRMGRSVMDAGKSPASWRMGRRWGRSVSSSPELLSVLQNYESASAVKSVASINGQPFMTPTNVERRKRESKSEKWANRGAGYIEQGTAGMAVLTQLGTSAMEMGANEGADILGEMASEGGSMMSEGAFNGGSNMADMMKKGATFMSG